MTDEEAEMLGYEAMFASFVPKGDETPLYTHAQLVEERRLAWNEAIEEAAEQCELWANKFRLALKKAQARKQQQEPRDLESIAMSVFRAFETRALTEDSTHD